MMKNYLFKRNIAFFIIIIICSICSFSGYQKSAYAKIEWSIIAKIELDDAPKDMALSGDNTTAYILGTKNILIYSLSENKVTDTIPITGSYSQITLSSDGEKLFVTDPESKEFSIIEISEVYDIPAEQSPVIGKSDAPVSIVAFLDFQCPYCARVYPVLEMLLGKYPNEVNLIIKHNPLRMHRYAENASLAALASAKQQKYREITKLLFDNYKDLNDDTIKKYLEEAGLDMEALNSAYNDPSLKKIIGEDLNLGARLKVRGVPTLFINGRRVKDRSLNALSEMVDQELAKGKRDK
ncbi:MAG: thioredoxin domain-containing protein [bacterium]